MLLNIIYIIAGIVLVLVGANLLTDGAVRIARRFNMPEIVIGLTIVAMGTSMPEFFVSLTSALKGTTDLAVGNVVGSNIFNTLIIVGVAATIAPITLQASTVHKDLPVSVMASLIVMAFCLMGGIGRIEALILLVCFIVYMTLTLRTARKERTEEPKLTPQAQQNIQPSPNTQHPSPRQRSLQWALCLLVTGLLMLIFGSNIFVSGAQSVASGLGVSEAVIGLTIVAGGTSLPELATSAVAASKGNSGIAIGNVLGSNVFNILAILGVTGLIQPLQVAGITAVDLTMMTFSAALLWFFCYTKLKVERWEGITLALIFIGYMAWLIYNA